MARNNSEKSPSGDPVVDAALRAWLRLDTELMRSDIREDERLRLRMRENEAYGVLSDDQRLLRSRICMGARHPSFRENLLALYGHEPEFKNGTQSK